MLQDISGRDRKNTLYYNDEAPEAEEGLPPEVRRL
jgi:hypothetical protein